MFAYCLPVLRCEYLLYCFWYVGSLRHFHTCTTPTELSHADPVRAFRCKSADETKEALYQAAVAATNEKFSVASEAEAAESGRQAAVRALAERDEQLRRGTVIQDKLQALCRELQMQIKQVSSTWICTVIATSMYMHASSPLGENMNHCNERKAGVHIERITIVPTC